MLIAAGALLFLLDAEILQKPDRPLPRPYMYLPTYLPTLLMGN